MPQKPANDRPLNIDERLTLDAIAEHVPDLRRDIEEGKYSISSRDPIDGSAHVRLHSREIQPLKTDAPMTAEQMRKIMRTLANRPPDLGPSNANQNRMTTPEHIESETRQIARELDEAARPMSAEQSRQAWQQDRDRNPHRLTAALRQRMGHLANDRGRKR